MLFVSFVRSCKWYDHDQFDNICKIKINTKYMTKTFGYTMGYHGLNGISDVQVPCITQEINEALYTSGKDQKYDAHKGLELNRIFAECLKKTLVKFEDKLK